MKLMLLRVLAVVVVLTPAMVFTQGAKTKPTTATYITKEEIDLVNKEGQGTDRNIRTVDIGHENFSIGIIHRGKTVDGVQVAAAGGAANAAAGGRAAGAAAPAPAPCGRQMATPPCGGMAYEAVKKQVKTGDIIIIPAGVVHGWLDIPEHVDYLSFRPSPGILTAGWVHPVLKK